MAESQDVNTLKRRGRRRLVGAIALVLLAVIVLPWIFDQQPRQTPPVSVRIPSQDETPFTPKPVPKPAPVEAAKPAPVPEPAKPAPPPAPVAERARAEAALANTQFMVTVGAFADPAGVIGKLKAAKMAYVTEPVATAKGPVTRVRAGPYATRAAAEKAHKQLKGLGLNPGNVTERP
jgi:DedD protein